MVKKKYSKRTRRVKRRIMTTKKGGLKRSVIKTMKKTERVGNKNYVTQYHYTPSINRHLIDMNTMTLRRDLTKCPKDKVKVKVGRSTKGNEYKCMDIHSKEAINQMLKFLNRSRNTNCITAPKQKLSNCWFNTMFMSFFISDMGYEFTKIVRQIMITGERINKTKIDRELHTPLLELNLAIQSSIDCVDEHYYLLENTNLMISKLSTLLPKNLNLHLPKPDEYGNPIPYYTAMINYILSGYEVKKHVYTIGYNDLQSQLSYQGSVINVVLPDILLISMDVSEPTVKSILKKQKKQTYIETLGGKAYRLDSMIISNDEHFISFHTINKKEYAFDGATYSKCFQMNWKKDINRNKNFNLYQGGRSVRDWGFNFTIGYQIMVYFRVK